MTHNTPCSTVIIFPPLGHLFLLQNSSAAASIIKFQAGVIDTTLDSVFVAHLAWSDQSSALVKVEVSRIDKMSNDDRIKPLSSSAGINAVSYESMITNVVQPWTLVFISS